MEHTHDKIFKCVHLDGTETVIKQVKSARYDAYGDPVRGDQLKTSIFVSSSLGCPHRCSFCHLTENKVKFNSSTPDDIVQNVYEAIRKCPFVTPVTPMSLWWAGMGDPAVDIRTTIRCTDVFIEELNISEINISSVKWTRAAVTLLNQALLLWKCKNLTRSRVFFSIHSGVPRTRAKILGTGNSKVASDKFLANKLRLDWKAFTSLRCDKVVHYTPVKGVSDLGIDAIGISQLIRGTNFLCQPMEVRMLELNPAPESTLERPSLERMEYLTQSMRDRGITVKRQISLGKESNSACGMFENNLI